jgi:hypothetical protein
MPARPYSGQPSFGQTFTFSFTSSLTLPGVIPPDISPQSCEGPAVPAEGPWQVHSTNPFINIPANICQPTFYMSAPLLSKLCFGWYYSYSEQDLLFISYAGSYLNLPGEAKL